MTKEEQRAAFLKAIAEEGHASETTRLVYADWLEENDEPEAADVQRQWGTARDWLESLAGKLKTTLDALVKAGHEKLDNYTFWPTEWDEMDVEALEAGDANLTEKFWRNWHVYAREALPPDDFKPESPLVCYCA